MLTHFIQSFGYLAIFGLMTLESVLVPVPSEVTMPFAGYLSSQGVFSLWAAIAAGTLGNLAGSLIAYYLGYVLEEHALVSWIGRFGRYFLIRESDYERGKAWFMRYGNSAVFFSRLLPGVRTYISLPAGMFEMRLAGFAAYTFIGSLLWAGLLAWAGYTLGNAWGSASAFLKPLEYAVIALVLIGVGWFLYRRVRR